MEATGLGTSFKRLIGLILFSVAHGSCHVQLWAFSGYIMCSTMVIAQLKGRPVFFAGKAKIDRDHFQNLEDAA
jgi:hypothetical protein